MAEYKFPTEIVELPSKGYFYFEGHPLSSGKVGNTDIIDEKFLVDDLENNEMGQGILSFDLEQVRYFNKSYDINELLNIKENIRLKTKYVLFNLQRYYIKKIYIKNS